MGARLLSQRLMPRVSWSSIPCFERPRHTIRLCVSRRKRATRRWRGSSSSQSTTTTPQGATGQSLFSFPKYATTKKRDGGLNGDTLMLEYRSLSPRYEASQLECNTGDCHAVHIIRCRSIHLTEDHQRKLSR